MQELILNSWIKTTFWNDWNEEGHIKWGSEEHNKWIRILGFWVVSYVMSCIDIVNERHKWMHCMVGGWVGVLDIFFNELSMFKTPNSTQKFILPKKKGGYGYGYGAVGAYTRTRTHTHTCFQCTHSIPIFFQFFIPILVVNGVDLKLAFWVQIQLPSLITSSEPLVIHKSTVHNFVKSQLRQ